MNPVPSANDEPFDGARSARAAPMAPDDRRAAILDAAVPLLSERGPAVTTRELAEAAGVAEGTLFRVFPDKAALVQAALDRALDPALVVAELGGAPHTDARAAVTWAVQVLHARSRKVAALFAIAYQLGEQGENPHRARHHGPRGGHRAHIQPVVEAVTTLLAPHAGNLRRPPDVCALMLVAVVLAVGGPLASGPDQMLTPDAVADLLIGGILRADPPC